MLNTSVILVPGYPAKSSLYDVPRKRAAAAGLEKIRG